MRTPFSPYRRRVGTETNVGVIGAGAWGTTLASLLTARTVLRLWPREPAVVEDVPVPPEPPVLDGFELPDELAATSRLDEALDGADVIIGAVAGALVEFVHRLGLLAATVPEIQQLDLNPLLVNTTGCVAVDALVGVASPAFAAVPARGLRGPSG